MLLCAGLLGPFGIQELWGLMECTLWETLGVDISIQEWLPNQWEIQQQLVTTVDLLCDSFTEQ